MQRINEHRFYELGTKVHPLTQVTAEDTIEGAFFHLWDSRESLLELLQQIPLKVSVTAARELLEVIDETLPRDFASAAPLASSDEKLGVRSYILRTRAATFETVLGVELQSLDTYFISQKGTYSTPDLIERAEIIFPESIRRNLPQQAVTDMREAGRCLVFDSPTACGFHILRALEAVMAEYFKLLTGSPIPARMRNWGLYIKKLGSSPNANQKIVHLLDHVREEYRNPITHPEVILTGDEAEVLLGVACAAMRMMALEIEHLRTVAAVASTPPTALAVAVP